MNNVNTQIKISSILYLLSSLLIIPFVPVLGATLLVLGGILLANSFLSLEELKQNKVSLIIIAIISFLLNIPAAIFIVIALSDLSTVRLETGNAPPPTSESKRIDLLLKLGLVMILISGVLFATTTWDIISNLVKVIALVVMGAIFLGLSKFSEIKLKIKSTTKAYYILGLSFFLLTWIGVGYFGVISPWFSYVGEGKNLVYFITLLLLGVFLYLINHKFKEKEYLYMGHMSIYLSIYHLLAATGLDLLQIIIFLSAISLVLNIIPNNKLLSTIKDINYPLSYLFWSIILTQCFEANKYVVLIACIINIVNVTLLALTNKSAFNQVLSAIISYALLIIGTLKLNIVSDNAIALFSVASVYSLLIKYQKVNQSKWLISTSQILYHLLATILIIIISTYSVEKTLIISAIYLGLNILNSLDLYKNNEQVDLRYQPIVIITFFLCLNYFINEKLVFVGEMLAFSLATFTYAVIYHLAKKPQVKNYYFVILHVFLAITFIFNLIFGEIVVAISTLLLVTYLYFTRRKEEVTPRILLYIAILLNVLTTSSTLTYYEVSPIITNIISLLIFILLTVFVKDKKLKTINYISIVVPLYSLVNIIDMADNLKLVITNIFWLYILFLFIKFIIKNTEAKDIISTIGLSIIILSIIFRADILVGIYIGILSIFIIFITFNEEHFKKLFYCGVVLTIVNIVVQLWEFWTQIPFYLYLLLVGIAIVAFVTYKELHKKDEPSKPKQQIQKNQQEVPLQIVSEPLQIEPSTIEEQEFVEQLEEPPVQNVEIPKQQPIQTEKQSLEQVKEERRYTPQVARFCPSCGRQNPGGKFCRSCGRNLQR